MVMESSRTIVAVCPLCGGLNAYPVPANASPDVTVPCAYCRGGIIQIGARDIAVPATIPEGERQR
jgi:hypothetical protein